MHNHTIPDFLGYVGGTPNLHFSWREIAGKRRLIGNPNNAMRILHQIFGEYVRRNIHATRESHGVRKLLSATGCVPGSNPTLNAEKHRRGKFFYITDLRNAYPSVDLDRLALIITFLLEAEYEYWISLPLFLEDEKKDMLRDDPLFWDILLLLKCHFAGLYGTGLAVGGPLSPYLMNMYCEVYLDSRLRRWCEKQPVRIVYTRFVDDLVFSSERIITASQRREVRQIVAEAMFEVNHRKSKVLALSQGAVFITKVGLEEGPGGSVARIVFPQKKRRKLHGIIMSYLKGQMDWPEKVSGLVSEFLYYYKRVHWKTATDQKTFNLCKAFEAEWARHRNA